MQFLIKLKTILPFRILIIVITFLYCFVYLTMKPISKFDIIDTKFIGVIEDIKEKDNKVQIVLKSKEKLLINYYLDGEEKFEYDLGDKILVIGKLNTPSNNTNFNLFNYKKYLLSKKINYQVDALEVSLVKSNTNFIYVLKNMLIEKIEKLDNKTYLRAFILGDTSQIPDKIKKSYQTNGISHLFSVSGMHVSFISGILFFILRRFNKKTKNIIIIPILFFLAFLVNFSPSVMRTILMIVLILVNRFLNLNIKTFDLFIILICLFLIYNPYYIYNTGFLYSFIITGFLIYYKDTLKSKNYILNVLKISLIAFLSGMPITMYNSFEINFLSPFLNLLFVPLVTFIIFPLSFLTLIFPTLTPVHLFFINIMESISLFFGDINILKFTFAKPHLIIILFYYIVIITILKNKKYLVILLGILIIHTNASKFKFNYNVTFLDVGQGDSLLLELPYDKGNILIDTGGTFTLSSNYISNNTIIPYLKSLGIKSLKYLIVTHGDYDHMGEAINQVNNFKVEKVIFNCGEFNDLEKELIKVLDKKKIKYYSCIKELNIDNNKLYFLNNKLYDNENDNSNVIYTELNNYKFLFMGDAGIEVEEDLIEKYKLQDIDVLKVGHHGSKTSSGKEFINEINPKYSIISVGKNNRYGHPNKEVLDNLKESKIYRTDKDGGVMFKIKNNILQIETCIS